MLKLAACTVMELEKRGSAGWNGDTSCNSGVSKEGIEGDPVSRVIFLGRTQLVLPCVPALLQSLYSSSFLGINVILSLAKLP